LSSFAVAQKAHRSCKERNFAMFMIDAYAAAGTFADKHKPAQDLANAIMRWEKAQGHLQEAL
jgi:hypothetical protein